MGSGCPFLDLNAAASCFLRDAHRRQRMGVLERNVPTDKSKICSGNSAPCAASDICVNMLLISMIVVQAPQSIMLSLYSAARFVVVLGDILVGLLFIHLSGMFFYRVKIHGWNMMRCIFT